MLCFYLILKLISTPSVLLIFVPIDNEMLLISVCTDMTQLVQNCGEEIMINGSQILFLSTMAQIKVMIYLVMIYLVMVYFAQIKVMIYLGISLDLDGALINFNISQVRNSVIILL